MGEQVLQGNLLDFKEPRMGGGLCRGEHVSGMGGNDIMSTIESGDHSKEG